MAHKIIWHFSRSNEFCGCDITEVEEFETWEQANTRVFELISKHQAEHSGPTTLTIEWYEDGDKFTPLYRRFGFYIPDRG